MQGFNLETSVLQQRKRAHSRNPRTNSALHDNGDAGQLCWDGVTTVGLELKLIAKDYQTQMGKDRRQTAWLLPFSGIPRKCTPPYFPPPLPCLLQPMTASPSLQIQEVHNSLGNKHCQVPYFKSLNTVGLSNTLSYHISFSFSFFIE